MARSMRAHSDSRGPDRRVSRELGAVTLLRAEPGMRVAEPWRQIGQPRRRAASLKLAAAK
jgi:hypothetical protein